MFRQDKLSLEGMVINKNVPKEKVTKWHLFLCEPTDELDPFLLSVNQTYFELLNLHMRDI